MQQPTGHRRRREYTVPRRFSIAEILGLMTVFGVLFGGLRWFHAPVSLYLFLATQAVVICLVQMRFGSVPRGASTLVGCVGMPIWVWAMFLAGRSSMPAGFRGEWLDVPIIVCLGGLLGYCTGVLAAGVFLVMDGLDSTLRRSSDPRTPFP